MRTPILFASAVVVLLMLVVACAKPAADEPRYRVLVSTDIGGTDPDDNQSMIHLMMYSDRFDLEGLVSSPSYGEGSKEEILRMIDLYAADYPKLKAHAPALLTPDSLRALCAQGVKGLSPYKGYRTATEGSDLIVKQARRDDPRPLYVLVWGTLEDVAQALHDAPDIADKIRVYYIGGPNKKWGVNSHAYIAEHFPNLWMIENNATYRGFITDAKDSSIYQGGYYDYAIRGAGAMGADFINYYGGTVKMGDTPSLLYMMHGDPADPMSDSWGGRFEPTTYTARRIVHHPLTEQDTVPLYAVVELLFRGEVRDIHPDSVCFTAVIDKQEREGFYLGEGRYALRYAPKAPATLTYELSSSLPELNGLSGAFVVSNEWPGAPHPDNYQMGANWYTDLQDSALFEGKWHGAATTRIWQQAIFNDWAERWRWLK